MAKLNGLGDLSDALENLKAVAEQIREALDEKRDWLNDKSEKYQEGESGQAWDEHLSDVESLLDEIDNLEMPDLE